MIAHYIEEHYSIILGLYTATFIFLQTFAIPGSIPMAVLAGALFKARIALVVVCLVGFNTKIRELILPL